LIAAKIASYSLGEADLLRRAMGKKIASEMAQQRDRFLSGAKTNGFDEAKSAELFDQMAKFAEYGFNKSHAAAYCVVAAQTAWIKRYYPVEFYAALLSTELSNTDKIVQYVKDARRHNYPVQAPHVNLSQRKFSVKGEEIFFGLAAIKGVGESAVDAIIEVRDIKPGKKFTDLEDFFHSIDARRINKKVIESLIKAGALDGFGATRAQLYTSFPLFLDRADKKKKEEESGQTSLFSFSEEFSEEKISLPQVNDWTKAFMLAQEKECLGFYLSDHPLKGIEKVMKPHITHQIEDLFKIQGKQKVAIGGLVATHKEFVTKKGTRMSFSQLEDLSGRIELIVFPDVYAQKEHYLKHEGPIIVSGTLENDEKGTKIIVENVSSLEERTKSAKLMELVLAANQLEQMERLKHIMKSHPGNTKVRLKLLYPELKREVHLDITEMSIDPSPAFLDEMQSLMGSLEPIVLM
jgi:DNA polymerase III subunit alpha